MLSLNKHPVYPSLAWSAIKVKRILILTLLWLNACACACVCVCVCERERDGAQIFIIFCFVIFEKTFDNTKRQYARNDNIDDRMKECEKCLFCLIFCSKSCKYYAPSSRSRKTYDMTIYVRLYAARLRWNTFHSSHFLWELLQDNIKFLPKLNFNIAPPFFKLFICKFCGTCFAVAVVVVVIIVGVVKVDIVVVIT